MKPSIAFPFPKKSIVMQNILLRMLSEVRFDNNNALCDSISIWLRRKEGKGRQPTITVFYVWQGNVKNPSFSLYKNLVFNLMLGLKCWRLSARRNDCEQLTAGGQKSCKVMFFNQHDKYQHIKIHDMKTCASSCRSQRICFSKWDFFLFRWPL